MTIKGKYLDDIKYVILINDDLHKIVIDDYEDEVEVVYEEYVWGKNPFGETVYAVSPNEYSFDETKPIIEEGLLDEWLQRFPIEPGTTTILDNEHNRVFICTNIDPWGISHVDWQDFNSIRYMLLNEISRIISC